MRRNKRREYEKVRRQDVRRSDEMGLTRGEEITKQEVLK